MGHLGYIRHDIKWTDGMLHLCCPAPQKWTVAILHLCYTILVINVDIANNANIEALLQHIKIQRLYGKLSVVKLFELHRSNCSDSVGPGFESRQVRQPFIPILIQFGMKGLFV